MDKKCLYCKKDFYSRFKKAKFCSRRCSDKGRVPKIKLFCLNCEKEFDAIPYRVKKRGRKFCSQKCSQQYRIGKNSASWKGGRVITFQGYVLRFIPHHPRTGNTGYVLEHKLVMEKHLGRYLLTREVVHHKNGNRSDNRIENLEIMSRSEHNKIHIAIRKKKFGGSGMPKRWT